MQPIFDNFPPLENSYSVIFRRMNSLHELLLQAVICCKSKSTSESETTKIPKSVC